MTLSIRGITLCLVKEGGSNICVFICLRNATVQELYETLAVFTRVAFLYHPVACTFSKCFYRPLFPDVLYLRKCRKSVPEQETFLALAHTMFQIRTSLCFASLVAHAHPLAHVPTPQLIQTMLCILARNILMVLAGEHFWLLSKLTVGDSAEHLHSEERQNARLAGRKLLHCHKTEKLMSQTPSNGLLVLCALGKGFILEKMSLHGTASWTSVRVSVLRGQHCIWYAIQKLLQKVHVNYILPHVESQAAKTYCSKHPCSHELQPLFASIQGKKGKKKKKMTSTLI